MNGCCLAQHVQAERPTESRSLPIPTPVKNVSHDILTCLYKTMLPNKTSTTSTVFQLLDPLQHLLPVVFHNIEGVL